MKNKLSTIAGLSLIEILIGVVVSSIMMAAMYTTYTVVNNTYSQVTDVASISRSGRDVIPMIMRDIRMAGYKYYYGYNSANEEKRRNGDNFIPRQEYLEYRVDHAPIIINRNTLNYNLGTVEDLDSSYLTIALDTKHPVSDKHPVADGCCDRIHIIYGDFNASDLGGEINQPYKKYRITYFARPMARKMKGDSDKVDDADLYYGLYRSKEYWKQPIGEDGGSWVDVVSTDACQDCYKEELVREYLVDMEFIALGRNGEFIEATIDNESKLYDIRSVDVRLTFRSSTTKGFYRKVADSKAPRIVKSLGNRTIGYLDSFLRDSVVVTVHTRNIGEMF